MNTFRIYPLDNLECPFHIQSKTCTQKHRVHTDTRTDLVPADETSEDGLSRSHESWMSGRLLTDSDVLLPIRPVRTFNLKTDIHIFNFCQ